MGIMLTCGGVISVFVQGIQFKMMVTCIGKHATLGTGCVLIAVSLALLPPTKVITIHLIIMLGMIFGEGYVEPGTPILIALYTLPTHLGFANGWASAFRGVAAVGAPILGGDLYDRCSGCAFYVASCFAWVAAVLVVISWITGREPCITKEADEKGCLRTSATSYG